MKDAVLAYRQAHHDVGEMSIDGSERLDRFALYEDWLAYVAKNASPETVDPKWVLTDTFFALDEAGEIVGVIDLRHELKGDLYEWPLRLQRTPGQTPPRLCYRNAASGAGCCPKQRHDRGHRCGRAQ